MTGKEKYFGNFPKAEKSDWEAAAREELQGADPWKKLSSKMLGIEIAPYYDATSCTNVAPLLPNQSGSFLGPRTWFNCPRVSVNDFVAANQVALNHLQQGADGILFDLGVHGDIGLLLKGIDPRHCSINFLLNSKTEMAKDVHQYFHAIPQVHDLLPGAVFCDPVSKLASLNPPISHLHLGGRLMQTTGAAEDDLRKLFVGLLEEDSISSARTAIRIPLGTSFFGDIITIRTARILWAEVQKKTGNSHPLFILGYSPVWTNEAYASHENMLKSSVAAMAGVLGGCDAITLDPEKNNELSARIARNVSNILREESHLSKVADPLAGTWFVENACQTLTQKIWPSLQPLIS
ncbi:MAG: hypothetical protein JST14_13230 [Bacteroidetes bacterium]|nr:hypothetical protein [Bacteroidota bacterium]